MIKKVLGAFCLISLLLTLLVGKGSAQQSSESKPVIDTSVLGKFPFVYGGRISAKANYVSYVISGQPRGSRTLVIQSRDGVWKKEYTGVPICYFSIDERQVVFQQKDSLCFLRLGGADQPRMVCVDSYQVPSYENGEWLAYQKKGPDSAVVVMNLLSGKEWQLGRLSNYLFSEKGHVLLSISSLQEGQSEEKLELLDLRDGTRRTIWEGKDGETAGNFRFDGLGQQLLFTETEKVADGADKGLSIWHYELNTARAQRLIGSEDKRIDSRLQLKESAAFSGSGRWIFLTLDERPVPRPVLRLDVVKVDVWGYRDRQLQPAQLLVEKPKRYVAVIDTKGQLYRQLEQGEEQLAVRPEQVTEDAVVISRPDSSGWADPRLRFTYPRIFYLLLLKDGSKQFLTKDKQSLIFPYFSPGGRYCVYYDDQEQNYFSYDLAEGVLRNITKCLPTKVSIDHCTGVATPAVDGVAGWLEGDKGVLLYDNYDIWNIDPSGRRPAANVTAGYGLKHHNKLRIVEQGEMQKGTKVYSPSDTLLLTGFKVDNKYNGFLRKILGEKRSPELLNMAPCTFYREESQKSNPISYSNGEAPRRAAKSSYWLVSRQSAMEAPNYFVTEDFKTYQSVSHLAPQTGYNWLTTQLITWHQLDGTVSQGVLYKPENFDPSKKYPVIFNYYEQLSHRLYEFPFPGWTENDINIPWFVSRGYLVFTPDIHYHIASQSNRATGYWAYNAIESAAHYLAKLPYVDGKRMGLQGHSFGGGETNYVITHSHFFAAAAEAAGDSDPISAYLTLLPLLPSLEECVDKQYTTEVGQGRMGATPWERPDLYLDQSAVLHANRVTTPLLILHNKKDNSIQWRQGIELYMALRRLEKRVWLLQYDEGGHSVRGRDAIDYTIRLTQFFDHYLKEVSPPKWMMEGVPARLKGVSVSYELDTSGMRP